MTKQPSHHPRIVIIVAPHERREALEAYRDRLTPKDIERLLTAPDDQFVKFRLNAKPTGDYSMRRSGLQSNRSSDE